MKYKIIAWKVLKKMIICIIFIIIIKITSVVMLCDTIKLMFSLDSDQVLSKDLTIIMLRITAMVVQNVVNNTVYKVANTLNIIA